MVHDNEIEEAEAQVQRQESVPKEAGCTHPSEDSALPLRQRGRSSPRLSHPGNRSTTALPEKPLQGRLPRLIACFGVEELFFSSQVKQLS